MTFAGDLDVAVSSILTRQFAARNGRVVPTTSTVGSNDAVKMRATFLYADLKDSSGLVAACLAPTVGKVLRVYLDVAARVIKRHGGEIKSFEGDRIMAAFIGEGAATSAVHAALQIKTACDQVIQPRLGKRFTSLVKAGWTVRPASGVPTVEAIFVRGGVRQHSDLVARQPGAEPGGEAQ